LHFLSELDTFYFVGRFQRIGGIYCPNDPEDGGSMFLRNINMQVPYDTNPEDSRIIGHSLEHIISYAVYCVKTVFFDLLEQL
jgi:hypothetical protein